MNKDEALTYEERLEASLNEYRERICVDVIIDIYNQVYKTYQDYIDCITKYNEPHTYLRLPIINEYLFNYIKEAKING